MCRLMKRTWRLSLDRKMIKVKATWSETVDFWGYYQKKIDFVMEEEY